jgi:putative tryptophan/tyrosine transport system substrate-binding protein
VQRLEELGWVNGRNVRIDTRFGDADTDAARLSTLATELVELGPNVILASGAQAAAAVRQQTLSLLIVFAHVAESTAVLCPMGYDSSTFTRARRHTSTEY